MMSATIEAPSLNHRLSVGCYGATIFLSSACLMVLEITAGRLLAPYIGVSLYTWTSIIGVILAGLSLGHWLGGIWADRGGKEQSVGLVLALGGLYCLSIMLLLTFIAPSIQDSNIGVLYASFLYVLILFFVPATLLGVVTPLLITLELQRNTQTGHVVGRLQALAAIGSIFGTFVTGYWLIQYFGTRNVISGTAIGLFLLAIPFLWRLRRHLLIFAISGSLLASITHLRQGFANPCDIESNYFCIRVVDESFRAPFGKASTLILDHLIHGISHENEPTMLIPSYMQLMDELVLSHFGEKSTEKLKFFFAGGGSYTQPRAVQALYPSAIITVAEIDPAVTQMAIDKLYFVPGDIRIIHNDARIELRRTAKQSFDIIVGDVFQDISIPYHLVTLEFLQLAKSRLTEQGIYLMNVVDLFPDPKLVKSLIKTLNKVFTHVYVWMENLPEGEERTTFVISAGDTHQPPNVLQAKRGFSRRWITVNEPMIKGGTPLSSLPVLTDDFVPVERLTSSLLLSRHGQ